MRKFLVLTTFIATACQGGDKPSEAPPSNDAPPVRVVEPDDSDEAAPDEPEEIEPLGESYITTVVAMRKEPTNDRRIPNPENPDKKMANWLATLHAGETVEVLEHRDDWSRAKASDDTEGWIQSKFLLATEEAKVVTVHSDAKVFRRPDLLALNASRTIDPTTLLFRLQDKEQFSEVRNGYRTEWVLTDKLIDEEREIEATKLLSKARWLLDQKDDGYEPLMELIKSQFGDTDTVRLAEAAMTDAEDEDAGEAAEEEKSN